MFGIESDLSVSAEDLGFTQRVPQVPEVPGVDEAVDSADGVTNTVFPRWAIGLIVVAGVLLVVAVIFGIVRHKIKQCKNNSDKFKNQINSSSSELIQTTVPILKEPPTSPKNQSLLDELLIQSWDRRQACLKLLLADMKSIKNNNVQLKVTSESFRHLYTRRTYCIPLRVNQICISEEIAEKITNQEAVKERIASELTSCMCDIIFMGENPDIGKAHNRICAGVDIINSLELKLKL